MNAAVERCRHDNYGRRCPFLSCAGGDYGCTWTPRTTVAPVRRGPASGRPVRKRQITADCPAPLTLRPRALAEFAGGLDIPEQAVRALLCARLLLFVKDYLAAPRFGGIKKQAKDNQRAAAEYLFGPGDPDDSFGFVSCCQLVGVDAKKARLALRAHKRRGTMPTRALFAHVEPCASRAEEARP